MKYCWLFLILLVGCSSEVVVEEEVSFDLEIVEENEYWVAYESPGETAMSLAWDGEYLWASDLFFGRFYKLSEVEDGLMIEESFGKPEQPFMQARDLTFDGENLWAVHWGDLLKFSNDLNVEFYINDREELHHMKSIAWDGENIWSALDGNVYKHGENLEVEERFGNIGSPAGMDFYNGYFWIAKRDFGFVEQYDRDFNLVNNYNIVEQPFGLVWGENLWIYDWKTDLIYKIKELPNASLDPEDDYLIGDYTLVDGVKRDTVWTLENSPYLATNGLSVEKGNTLTIEPGVKVYFGKGSPLNVEGKLIAEGTEEEMIVFSHKDQRETWGSLEFYGEEASDSRLEFVKVQYAADGIKAENAVPSIKNSIFRKVGVYGATFTLANGTYDVDIEGNAFLEGGGDGINFNIHSDVEISKISFLRNTISYFYSPGPIFNTMDEFEEYPEILVEGNIFEKNFRGVGAGFSGLGDVVYRNNYHRDGVSGSGVQFFHPGNTIEYNYIENTFELGAQLSMSRPDLVEMRGPGDSVFRYNTMKMAGVPTNFGDPSVVIEYNNLILNMGGGNWLEASDYSGAAEEMKNNWWGISDEGLLREHILDFNVDESRNRLVVEPILKENNGVGFVKGNVGSVREVEVGGKTVVSNVIGDYFVSLREGDYDGFSVEGGEVTYVPAGI